MLYVGIFSEFTIRLLSQCIRPFGEIRGIKTKQNSNQLTGIMCTMGYDKSSIYDERKIFSCSFQGSGVTEKSIPKLFPKRSDALES